MYSNLQLDPVGFGIVLPSLASVLCGYTSILRDNQFPNATIIYSILAAMPTHEINNAHYSCRLTETSSHLLRQMSSLTIIECAFDVLQFYHEEHTTFELDKTTVEKFIEKVKNIIKNNYEQYKALFRTERKSVTSPQLPITFKDDDISLSSATSQSSNAEKVSRVCRQILLFDSVAFTKTHLYTDPYTKRNNNLLEVLLKDLTKKELLAVYPLGAHNEIKSLKLYVKQLPYENELTAEIIAYEEKLREYGLNYLSFKQACVKLNFAAEKAKIKVEPYRQISFGPYSKIFQQDISSFLYKQSSVVANKPITTSNIDPADKKQSSSSKKITKHQSKSIPTVNNEDGFIGNSEDRLDEKDDKSISNRKSNEQQTPKRDRSKRKLNSSDNVNVRSTKDTVVSDDRTQIQNVQQSRSRTPPADRTRAKRRQN
ncbi:unnamed protein product [Didymodactylos carnosus]|uniref:Uncharacterized protein n=1 Tax=Didymodactylos carnosus TaxID=1234261 RepID=A0A815FH05_9BILA|nr:unnamed protein product [Didymodactylos carnosus]CAF1326554.1 unnamed protein product [Didymodactylos carnosus]CAF4022335.1 unnamed protein product [Didymodactylos carnosus]CAF4176740.1 unnamed protein product [Didymodactylos carnosus]